MAPVFKQCSKGHDRAPQQCLYSEAVARAQGVSPAHGSTRVALLDQFYFIWVSCKILFETSVCCWKLTGPQDKVHILSMILKALLCMLYTGIPSSPFFLVLFCSQWVAHSSFLRQYVLGPLFILWYLQPQYLPFVYSENTSFIHLTTIEHLLLCHTLF